MMQYSGGNKWNRYKNIKSYPKGSNAFGYYYTTQINQEGIMGSWGIKSRDSDAGLNFLDLIIDENLKKIDFREFNINAALKLLKKYIIDEIKQINEGCSKEKLKFYFEETFPERYADAVLLIAECLTEFLQNGEFVFNDYEEKKLIEKRITTFVYTADNLRKLLKDLRASIKLLEEFDKWFEESNAKKWKAHVEDMYTTIENEFKSYQKDGNG